MIFYYNSRINHNYNNCSWEDRNQSDFAHFHANAEFFESLSKILHQISSQDFINENVRSTLDRTQFFTL